MEQAQTYQKLKSKLSDREWRLNNLYKIKDKKGRVVTFKMNWAQRDLYENLHYVDVILKARQLGFTTFVLIYFLDACLFNSNHSAGVIAHTLNDAQELFKNKVRFAYDKLPEWLKAEIPATSDSARTLEFSNGSSIYVGTSLRSGTFQKLLVSEYGKLSAKYPDKAKEVKTGALNTVESGQQIFIESTAEGKTGEFYDLCETARKLSDSGKALARIEPKFFFYPWWRNPDYVATPEEVKNTPITEEQKKYFARLGVGLTAAQKAWYVLKLAQQGEDMKQEYPSTPEEAFEGSLEGAFYTDEMKHVRANGQIGHYPYDERFGVYTWWDLGTNDLMTCLFYQNINGQHRFIDYYENNNEGWGHYANMLREKGYNYIRHFFPHDGNNRMRGTELFTDKQAAQQSGIRPIKVTNRSKNVWKDIQRSCKPMLKQCYFHEETCGRIIAHLDNYRRKFNKVTMMYTQEELHDEASHGASSFRTFAVNPELVNEADKKPNDDGYVPASTSWMS